MIENKCLGYTTLDFIPTANSRGDSLKFHVHSVTDGHNHKMTIYVIVLQINPSSITQTHN